MTIRNTSEWRKCKAVAKRVSDWICYLCGRDISRGAVGDLSVEVDHIIPISRGGDPFNQENLALTHRICNRIKGSQYYEEVLKSKVAKNAVVSMDDVVASGIDWLSEEDEEGKNNDS